MRTAASRTEWFIAAAPVVCGLLIYAMAQGRWLLGAPLVLGTLVALWRDVRVERHPLKLSIVATVGMLLGFVFFVEENAPPTAIPPVLLSPLTGALACLCCYVLLTRQPIYAWLYSWLLAVLSLLVPPQGPILILFLALLLTTLLCCLVLGGAARAGWAGAVGFVVFVGSVSVVGYQLVRLAQHGEETLLSAAGRWLTDWEPPGGIALQSEIAIGSRSAIGRSNRSLIELEGPATGYLRTHVMEKFDGALWSEADDARGAVKRAPGAKDEPATRTQEMLLLEKLVDVIPAPAGTMSVEGTAAKPERGWVWRSIEPPERTLVLHRTEREELPQEGAPGQGTVEVPEMMREEFKALAMEIVQGGGTTRQKADRIERFFQSKFEYSLDTDLRGPGHPLSVLIRERRPAYCIYFASAMAVLLRSLDVPARLVGGFAPSDVNPFTKRVIVRARDAHAWVEVYVPEEGRWVAYDPTPSQSREAVVQERGRWLKMAWEAFVSVVRRGWIAFREDPVGTIVAMLTSPVGLLVVLAIVVWQVRKRWRGFVIRRKETALESNDPELRAAYRQYRAMLKRLEIVPAEDETDDDLIARIRQSRGESSAQAAAVFIDAYRRARYANGVKTTLRSSLQQLDAELKRAG